MQIFDYIKNVLFFKKTYQMENVDEIKKYNIFMINRWVSMNDAESANLINETTNRVNYLSNDREMHYRLLLNVLPQKPFNKINYIKKTETE